MYFGRFAIAEEEVTYESSGPQVKSQQWVEARNTNGKLHKLKSVLLVSGYWNAELYAILLKTENFLILGLSFLLALVKHRCLFHTKTYDNQTIINTVSLLYETSACGFKVKQAC